MLNKPIEQKEPDRLSLALNTIEMMETLMHNPGWQFLCGVIQSHIDNRFSTIIEQRGSMDELISQEYLKGETKAFIMVKNLPAVLVEDSKARIMELENADDNQG